jgi:hypothetical protein
VRGVALVFMVVNHTARWWIDGRMTWPRYNLIYVTLTLAAPMFLFLVGFCLPLAVRSTAEGGESLGALLRKFGPRGARIVLAGFLLNLIVFPDEPILSGGVLQTIGLAIILMAPAIWLLRVRGGAVILLALAVAGYVGFVLAFPWLTRFVAKHDVLGLVLFFDFPPWPWLSLVLIGLVMGWAWLHAYRQGPQAGARFMAAVGAAGVAMVVAFFLYDWWAASPMRFGMRRDFILNRHWTPRGAALLWVLGMTLAMLAAAFWIWERRQWRLRALVILGQTALFLYFLHQVIVYTIVRNWLGWRFPGWPAFCLANAVLLLGLLGAGRAWLDLKRALRRLPLPLVGRASRRATS